MAIECPAATSRGSGGRCRPSMRGVSESVVIRHAVIVRCASFSSVVLGITNCGRFVITTIVFTFWNGPLPKFSLVELAGNRNE